MCEYRMMIAELGHYVVMVKISCPECGGTRLTKYGKTLAGRQKYKCSSPICRHQFVAGSDHLVNPDIKDRVIKLLTANVHPTQIAKAEQGISLRWLYELRRRMKNDQR